MKKAALAGTNFEGRRAVAILTGHGLKDPDTAMKLVDSPIVIDAKYDALIQTIEGASAA